MQFLTRLIDRLLPDYDVPVDEQRAAVRLQCRAEIGVRVGERIDPATVVNVTFTGLCIEFEEPLSEGQRVRLLRNDYGPPFNGTVLWCKPEGSHYLIGIECELNEDLLVESWLLPTLEQAGFEAHFVDERRRLVRVPGKVPCKITAPSGEPVEGKMLDLSHGGALVECNVKLPPDKPLQFETSPLGDLPRLRGTAEVTSYREGEEGAWLCGLRFTDCRKRDIDPYMASMLISREEA